MSETSQPTVGPNGLYQQIININDKCIMVAYICIITESLEHCPCSTLFNTTFFVYIILLRLYMRSNPINPAVLLATQLKKKKNHNLPFLNSAFCVYIIGKQYFWKHTACSMPKKVHTCNCKQIIIIKWKNIKCPCVHGNTNVFS